MTKQRPFEIVKSAMNGTGGSISYSEIRTAMAILKKRLERVKTSHPELERVEFSNYVEELLRNIQKNRSKELMKKAASLL